MRLFCLFALLLAPLRGGGVFRAVEIPVAEMRGLDVSHHQKIIAWDTLVSQQKPQFVFVKATEGADFTDSLFCHNWESLSRLGVRRGAYHFFRSYGCGVDQALHFLETIDLHPGDLAPVLDIETTDGVAPEIMLEEARVWLQMVERRLKVKPIIYTNQNFYEKYLAGAFDNHPLWIARYSDERPSLSSGKMWDFWQYSNQGCFEGIDKHVDLNVFLGTPAMLDRLCWYPEAPPSAAAAAP